MKTITLKELTLRNFKGVRQRTIVFDGSKITSIKGDNAEGKTTTLDAWSWLTSGKNSEGKKDFGIKTYDESGKTISKLEHEVSAIVDCNGTIVSLKKVLKEKWTKPRNQLEEVFSGHTTDYYIDDVPYKESEYYDKVAFLIANEELSKILSNVTYFTSLKRDRQREMLIKLAPKVNDLYVIESLKGSLNESQVSLLLNTLNENKSIELFKKEISAKKSKVKEEAKSIPSRIDEVQRSMMPEEGLDQIDMEISKLDIEKQALQVQKENIFKAKSDAHQNHLRKATELNNQKYELQVKYDALVRNSSSVNEAKLNDLNLLANQLSTKAVLITSEIKELGERKSRIETQNNEYESMILSLNKQWEEINASSCNAHVEENCPSCQRPYDADKVQEQKSQAITNFNVDKVSKLENIKIQIGIYQSNIEGSKSELVKISEQSNKLNEELIDNQKQFISINGEIQKTKEAINNTSIPEEATKIKSQIEAIVIPDFVFKGADAFEIDNQIKAVELKQSELKSKLSIRTTNENAKNRLSELDSQLQKLNVELNELESKEYSAQMFERTRINIIEQSVNSMFKYVKFKMFETQVNGEEVPTCECMVDGVVFSDLNTAAKINAGFDIINTFSEKLQTTLPVFIDNKESVSKIENIEDSVLPQIIFLEKVTGSKFEVVNHSVKEEIL